MTALASDPVVEDRRSSRATLAIQPFHLLVPVAAIATLLISIRPVADPDVYWHTRLGADILRRHSVSGAGTGWTILPPAHAWRSPEWLADISLHGLVSSMGWRGILVFQVALSVAFLFALGLAVLPGRDARAGAVVYAVTSISLASYLQARPQTVSLVMLCGVAAAARALLRFGRVPRLVLFLPAIWLWAQLHGLWLLAPAAIALAAALRLLDHDRRGERDVLRRSAVAVAAGLAVGCINPLGISSLTLPLRLHSATSTITEWHATTFTPYFTWGLLGLFGWVVIRWSTSLTAIPRSELAWVGLVALFGLTAYRNVAVATLLIAPVVADRVSMPGRRADVGPRESRILQAVAATLSLCALGIAAVGTVSTAPIPRSAPVGLARMLDDGQPHRVLDDYNTGGLLLVFGGPKIRVAVDGRADYFGGAFLDRYKDLMRMTPGWQRLFRQLDPDTALILTKSPLNDWLPAHGWTRSRTQGSYTLWRRVGTHG